MNRKKIITIICFFSLFFANSISLSSRGISDEETINEAIDRHYDEVEKQENIEQTKENSTSVFDEDSLGKGFTSIKINSVANIQNREVDEILNKLENYITSLLAEKKINKASTSTTPDYVITINYNFNEITNAFANLDISILKKSKLYGHFSIDLTTGQFNKDELIFYKDLGQICARTINILLNH